LQPCEPISGFGNAIPKKKAHIELFLEAGMKQIQSSSLTIRITQPSLVLDNQCKQTLPTLMHELNERLHDKTFL
jgi:hypothetical protein